MLALLKYIMYVPTLISLIQAVVGLVEGVKAGASGPEKKQAVMDSLAASWSGLGAAAGIKVPFKDLSGVIGILIDLVVMTYNTIGHFTHKDAAPVPTA
jgi:hypothetical protein